MSMACSWLPICSKKQHLQYVVQYPLQAFRILYWLVDGKSNLKIELANCVNPGIETVPLREEVLALIRNAQVTGRSVYLASSSDHRYIVKLAERIGGIAGVFGIEPNLSLAGENQSRSAYRRIWNQGIRLCRRYAGRLCGMALCA